MSVDILLHASPVLLSSSSDSDGGATVGLILLVLPFVVGFLLYRAMYRRYRNHDKRYQFEHTTTAVRSNLRRWDTFTRENNRQRRSEIAGRNDDKPLERARNVAVEEVDTPRQAQEAREAQEPRLAQEPRVAEPERVAQEVREPQPRSAADPSAGPT